MLAGQYRPGDVIAVEDDTHVWGALDIGPHNQIVIMPGVSAALMSALLLNETWPVDANGIMLPITQVQFFPRLRISNVNTHATLPVGGICRGSVLGNVFSVTQPPAFPIAVNHAVCGLTGVGHAVITALISGTGGAGTYRLGTVFGSAVSARQLVVGPVPPNAVPATWIPANTISNPQIANPDFTGANVTKATIS